MQDFTDLIINLINLTFHVFCNRCLISGKYERVFALCSERDMYFIQSRGSVTRILPRGWVILNLK